jgi:RimJ/RimL family protein N-acetyltransferase
MENLQAVHRLLDKEIDATVLRTEKMTSVEERREWLEWSVLNYTQLAKLDQPPYGDRAIVMKSTQELIGACGYVPCLNVFEQMPNLPYFRETDRPGRYTAEVGLFYAVSPAYRRQGYAAEAARALVDYGFEKMQLRRIVATTDYDNIASMGVMRKLGMTIAKNPQAGPPWLQVVGTIEQV